MVKMINCVASDCVHWDKNEEGNCELKEIEIKKNGMCKQYHSEKGKKIHSKKPSSPATPMIEYGDKWKKTLVQPYGIYDGQ